MTTTVYDPTNYLDALRTRMLRAQDNPTLWLDGMTWYARMRSDAERVASAYGMTLDHVLSALSALSPRNRWRSNVADSIAYVHAYATGYDMPSASTFTACRLRAWSYLHNADVTASFRGLKTASFRANLHGDEDAVTVDVWAIRAATDGREDAVKSDAQYRAIASAYRIIAAEFGVSPAQCQAIVWTVENGRVTVASWALR